MKTLLNLEELAMLAASILLFRLLDMDWWMYAAFFLAPDIGMLGYLVNTKVGAATYNLTHHKAIGIGLMIIGWMIKDNNVTFIGIIILGHASFDRILGYGLKHSDNFKHTHLGWIGKR